MFLIYRKTVTNKHLIFQSCQTLSHKNITLQNQQKQNHYLAENIHNKRIVQKTYVKN